MSSIQRTKRALPARTRLRAASVAVRTRDMTRLTLRAHTTAGQAPLPYTTWSRVRIFFGRVVGARLVLFSGRTGYPLT